MGALCYNGAMMNSDQLGKLAIQLIQLQQEHVAQHNSQLRRMLNDVTVFTLREMENVQRTERDIAKDAAEVNDKADVDQLNISGPDDEGIYHIV